MKTGVAGSINKMLKNFKRKQQPKGEKLKFEGAKNKDVYNITAPFKYNGKRYLIGRVESPDKETDSQSIFFTEKEGTWYPVKSIPALNLQDPFFSQINGDLIVGGVEVFPKEPISENPGKLSWLTVYYRGTDIARLEEFARSPDQMKDLRIIKLSNGKIGVFTRPGYIQTRSQDGIGGMIGYTEIDSLDDLTIKNINKAEIIDGLFIEKEWGGVNELYLLKNGRIGVLGHIAYITKGDDSKIIKHYYAMTFIFNPKTREISQQKIIATSDNFPLGEAKRPDLQDVIFSGGLIRHDDITATLYVGLRDKEAGSIKIKDPFAKM